MIGTLFLWMFWPAFNGALCVSNAQERAIVNTLLSMCGSCVVAFIASHIFRREKKFHMVDKITRFATPDREQLAAGPIRPVQLTHALLSGGLASPVHPMADLFFSLLLPSCFHFCSYRSTFRTRRWPAALRWARAPTF